MKRRHFLETTLVASIAASLSASVHAAEKRAPRILLRSSWQTVNIGDIAHTPGVLAILEKHFPEAEVRLWPSNVGNGVEEMLRARFPKVQIVKGAEDLKTAFAESDFLLHGSGPSLVAEKDVVRWNKETGKPYGIFGITFSMTHSTATKPTNDNAIANSIEVLSGAKFVFFRDSTSLELAKSKGCTCPVMEFGPDGAFATDLRDDDKADAFLKAHGLEVGKFLCCISRLRYTPYWTIPAKKAVLDDQKHARNESMKEHDCKPLRDAITAVVKNTDLKILLCPEDETRMAVNKEMLLDKLPDDVRNRCVWRENYWLTAEALSTYRRSAGLFGHEMHSPIMCIGNSIPAIVCRWSEQTSKGIMWRDIGLGDWLFDFDNEVELKAMPFAVLAMAKDHAAAKAKAAKGHEFVVQRQRDMIAVLRRLMLVICLVGISLGSNTHLIAQDAKAGSIEDYANSLRAVQADLAGGRITEAQKRLDSTDKFLRNFEFEILQKQVQIAHSGGVASDIIRFIAKPEVNVRYAVLNELDLRLVSICQDGGLRIHDFNSKELHAKTVSYPEGGPIWTGAFSRDGKTFVSGHQNGEAVVWNPAAWEVLHKIPVSMKSPVRELIVAPNGSSIVAEGEKFLELWSLEGEKPTKIDNVGERLNFGEGLAFSPKGDRLATGGMFDVRLYDARTGKQLNSMTHASYTMGLEFSPDGKRIASAPRGNVNKFLAVFDVHADRPLFNAGPFGNYIVGMAFTPDGMRIAATGCEKVLRLFDAATGVIVLTLDRKECCSKPAFSRDGRLLGWSEPDGYHYVDLATSRAAE